MTLMTEGKTLVVGGEQVAPQAAMPQIEKERSWAKPKQLPAGPRKKRPLGRLFSSYKHYKHCSSGSQCSGITIYNGDGNNVHCRHLGI